MAIYPGLEILRLGQIGVYNTLLDDKDREPRSELELAVLFDYMTNSLMLRGVWATIG